MEYDPGGTHAQTGGRSQVGQATEQAKQQGQQLATQARQQASKLANQGGEQVKGQLANQKHNAAQRIAPVQTALREAAHQLRNQGQGSSAQYVDRATDQLERVSGYLRDTDVDEMIGEVRGFARRRPALFLGGAAALGFFASRFLKSSSLEQDASRGESYETTGTALGGAEASYGAREPAAALPPGGFEGGYPTAERPLGERERVDSPEGPSTSPRGY
ncbi:MAG: hypothetical protein M3Q60_21695 [Actinomycetota bacterium]|nr:hypothetical protein [Actinomycetota bacterium]